MDKYNRFFPRVNPNSLQEPKGEFLGCYLQEKGGRYSRPLEFVKAAWGAVVCPSRITKFSDAAGWQSARIAIDGQCLDITQYPRKHFE